FMHDRDSERRGRPRCPGGESPTRARPCMLAPLVSYPTASSSGDEMTMRRVCQSDPQRTDLSRLRSARKGTYQGPCQKADLTPANVVNGLFGKERTCWQEDRASPMVSHKIPPEGETQMAYSLYDAAVTPCAQQLGALAGIIDKAGAHCATNKIEESALLQDRLYPDMFCLARQIRQAVDFAKTALGFVKSLTRAQVDGAEGKLIAWTAGGNDRKMKGNDYLQQF